MDMTGEYRIPASQQAVWEALNDPDVLKASIPGCETVEKLSDTKLTAKVTIKVGPVKAKFTGNVTLSDLDPPNGYTISGQGKGGAAGFGSGSAQVAMREEGGETVLTYSANASVGGKLAQIGQRLINSTSKKIADEFFANFVDHLATTGVSAPAAEETLKITEGPPSSDQEYAQTNTGNPWLVVLGIIVIFAALGFFLR